MEEHLQELLQQGLAGTAGARVTSEVVYSAQLIEDSQRDLEEGR